MEELLLAFLANSSIKFGFNIKELFTKDNGVNSEELLKKMAEIKEFLSNANIEGNFIIDQAGVVTLKDVDMTAKSAKISNVDKVEIKGGVFRFGSPDNK